MSSTLAADIFVSGDVKTLGNVQTNNSFQYLNPEVLTASGAMNPYRPSVLRQLSTSMTLTNLGAGVTTVVEKPIFNLTGAAVTVAENSNTWTIPATSNVATAMWTIDRWLITSYTSLVPTPPSLYSFTTATFNTGGATGSNGPIISQARSGLTGTPAPSNWYNTYLNMTTQGIQLWTVPATGTYTITVAGARSGYRIYNPGYGHVISSNFTLTSGNIIGIVVGQAGEDPTRASWAGQPAATAGGGGTFVFNQGTSTLLICAGGGGGHGNNGYSGGNGSYYSGGGPAIGSGGTNSNQANSGSNGYSATPAGLCYGGDGNGASQPSLGDCGGGGGGGWGLSYSFRGGLTYQKDSGNGGNMDGGFGGGGSAGYNNYYNGGGAGGGGGYQGGSGSNANASNSNLINSATGGYSYSSTSYSIIGTNNGDGYVTITKN